MSLFSTIEGYFAQARVPLHAVKAGAATLDTYAGSVLQAASDVKAAVSVFDPQLGAAVSFGMSALQLANGQVGDGLAADIIDTTGIAGKVAEGLKLAVNLAVLVAPFTTVAVKPADAIDPQAVAAARAVSVTAPATAGS